MTDADLSDWETWDTGHGTMAKTEIRTNGRRMGVQLRGRDSPILVVGVPPERTDIGYGERIKMDMGISRAVENVKGHVSECVSVARTECREKYGIHSIGPPMWYRKPEISIENFPGLPKGVSYRISYVWVDSSPGHTELETNDSLTLYELMDIGNQVSKAISTPLDDRDDGDG